MSSVAGGYTGFSCDQSLMNMFDGMALESAKRHLSEVKQNQGILCLGIGLRCVPAFWWTGGMNFA